MALTQVSASLSLSIRDACAFSLPRTHAISRLPISSPTRIWTTTFSTAISRTSHLRKPASRATSISIRCEQGTKDSNSADVWLGRLAMVGFAVAISVEIATGKGLLENFGLTTPLPTVALAVTALLGVLAAELLRHQSCRSCSGIPFMYVVPVGLVGIIFGYLSKRT